MKTGGRIFASKLKSGGWCQECTSCVPGGRIVAVIWAYIWCCRLKRRQDEGASEAACEDANGDREAEAAATDEDAPEPEPEPDPEPESSSKLSMCGSVCSSPGSC